MSLSLVLAACGGSVAGLCEWSGNTMDVDASCLPDAEWPLTVDSGVLTCDPPDVWIEVAGRSYAINGAASNRDGVEELEQIWKVNPEIPGARINVGPLHDLVREKCSL
jgi:hypothetical protein